MTLMAFYDASSEQRQSWNYHVRLEPYQRHQIVVLEAWLKDLDMELVTHSLALLVQRNEGLRTYFICTAEGKLKQAVTSYDEAIFSPDFHDLRDCGNVRDRIAQINDGYLKWSWRLDAPPLLKSCIVRTADNDYRLCIFLHHIICDAWTRVVIRNELQAIYAALQNGAGVQGIAANMQLHEYSEWQGNWLETNGLSIRAYWEGKLSVFSDEAFGIRYGDRMLTLCPLPGEAHLFSDRKGFIHLLNTSKAASYFVPCGGQAFERLVRLSNDCKCSLNAVVNTSLKLLFLFLSGNAKTLFAIPLAARYLQGSENVLGFLGGGIYLHLPIPMELSVAGLIKKVYAELLRSAFHIIYDHEEMGLDEPVLRTRCDLFVNYVNSNIIGGGQLTLKEPIGHVPLEAPVHYGLSTVVVECEDGLAYEWRYKNCIYSPSTIEFMIDKYEKIVNGMAAYPAVSIEKLFALLELDPGSSVTER